MQFPFRRQLDASSIWKRHAIPIALTMMTAVFLADLVTPLGVASGVPYSLAILAALNASTNRSIVLVASTCSLLTVLAMFLGPGPGNSEIWKVITNRSLALSMIWITYVLGMMRRNADDQRRVAEEMTRIHLTDLAHMGRLKTVGQLATGLAHELNSPLAAISLQAQVASELVRRSGPEDTTIFNSLQEITTEAERAANIVRSLRNLVKKSTPKQEPVQISEIIHEVVRLIDFRIKQAQVELTLELERTPEILGDRIQLQQVILNLLQNAIDAVSTANVETRRITIESRFENQKDISVRVKDTGPGFFETDPGRVFERFFSSKPNGMGMGLAISRSIIEAHDGRLWAEKRRSGGAKFEFSLPLVT